MDLVSQIKIIMKKILSLFVIALLTTIVTGQVSKTVNVATAGTLSTLLTVSEKTTVTNFTITGNIDARDVKCMRDEMTMLAVLDMGGVSIKEYIGIEGTYYPGSPTIYPVNEIPQNSFANKTNIKNLTLPTNITSIGIRAFNNCSGLMGSLILPKSLTVIGGYAFSGCTGFTGSLTFPNSVITIGDNAFNNCSGFTGSLTLGSALTSIADNAFYNCSGLKIINSLNATPPTIGGTNAFSGVSPSVVYVPENAGAAYKTASGWSGFTIIAEKRVTINVPTAGGMAAVYVGGGNGTLASVTNLTVTGNLNSVDVEQMKTNMTALTSIDLSGAVLTSNTLPANAFQGRTSLISVILPNT